MTLKVHIVDDDFEFCKWLLPQFQAVPSIQVFGWSGSIQGAKEWLLATHPDMPDLFLIDLGLPDGDGCDLITWIRSFHPDAVILGFTTLGDAKHIIHCLKAGASGYLLKSESFPKLCDSIFSAVTHRAYLSAHASQVVIHQLQQDEKEKSLWHSAALQREMLAAVPDPLKSAQLTPRELEVLRQTSLGKPAKVLASELGISVFTVNQHMRSIFKKLNARNKIEAISNARRIGVLH